MRSAGIYYLVNAWPRCIRCHTCFINGFKTRADEWWAGKFSASKALMLFRGFTTSVKSIITGKADVSAYAKFLATVQSIVANMARVASGDGLCSRDVGPPRAVAVSASKLPELGSSCQYVVPTECGLSEKTGWRLFPKGTGCCLLKGLLDLFVKKCSLCS